MREAGRDVDADVTGDDNFRLRVLPAMCCS
jgi:hypothetical protein